MKGGLRRSTFLLQDGAAAAPPDVVLHVAGVVGQVGLVHGVERQGQLHLLLAQVLPQNPGHTHTRQVYDIYKS